MILVCLLSIAVMQITLTTKFTSAQTDGNGSAISVPLTNVQINAAWPNLPTAQQLWNSTTKCWIDTDQEGANAGPIENCTYNVLSSLGDQGYEPNVPSIWLQYNTSVWIQIPVNLLQDTTQVPTYQRQQAPSPQQTETWALGLYTNPSQIAGSSVVGGAVSTAIWGNNFKPSSSDDYLHWDVLTAFDGTYFWQVTMTTSESQGTLVTMQGYNTAYQLIYYRPYSESITPGTFYNSYIRYNSNINPTGWQFYWNFNSLGVQISDGQTQMTVGNQPSVAIESNDLITTDFTNFNTHIGSIYNWGNGTETYEPAIAFLFNGAWQPYLMTDHVPAAYVYWGGSYCPTPNWGQYYVGNTDPYNWMSESSPATEQLSFSPGSIPSMGSTLWRYK